MVSSRINVLNGLITGSGSLTIVANNTDGRYDFNAANTFTGGVTVLSGPRAGQPAGSGRQWS